MSQVKVRSVIIEDEPHARQRLRRLLKEYKHIDIAGEASNGEEGLQLILDRRPDLIFLDIQMPLLNGFEMLKKLKYEPKIIFTTAYEEFALDAFAHNSIDYLLKPFSAERLSKAIEKLQNLTRGVSMKALEAIMEGIQEKRHEAMTISQAGKIFIVPYREIVFLKADQKCTQVLDAQNKSYLTYTSLQKLKERLPANFLQVHRTYIINLDYVLAIRKGFGGKLIFDMSDSGETTISTGKTYSKEVKEALGL